MKRELFYIVIVMLVSLMVWGCAGDQGSSDSTEAEDTSAVITDEGAATEMESETATETAETKTEPTVESKPKEKPKPATVTVTLPESTEVRVVLVDSIDTDLHTTGQEFRGMLTAAVISGGKVLFDSGAAVIGVLDSVVESGRLKSPAELMFSLRTIERDGNPVAVSTYSIHEKKEGKTARDVALIGGGAVVGGIVGKMTGKKGGTEIGAVAGAAAGAGAAAATGKDDIVHSAGTEAVFLLKDPLTMTVPK